MRKFIVLILLLISIPAPSGDAPTVLVFGDPDDIRRDEARIRRLIDENKPAHTVYSLRLVGDGAMGTELRIGVNTRLAGACAPTQHPAFDRRTAANLDPCFSWFPVVVE